RTCLEKPDLVPAGLIALDQMDGGGLQAATVLPFLASSDQDVRKAANWVAGHHSDWGDALASYFKQNLTAREYDDSERSELQRKLAQFSRSEAIQQLMTSILGQSVADSAQKIVLHAMSAVTLKEPPAKWVAAVKACLMQTDDSIVRAAVPAAR